MWYVFAGPGNVSRVEAVGSLVTSSQHEIWQRRYFQGFGPMPFSAKGGKIGHKQGFQIYKTLTKLPDYSLARGPCDMGLAKLNELTEVESLHKKESITQ
jgi:hypothetical protein